MLILMLMIINNNNSEYIIICTCIKQKLSEEDMKEGPPELMFVHAGHTSRISELDWNPTDSFVLSSGVYMYMYVCDNKQ